MVTTQVTETLKTAADVIEDAKQEARAGKLHVLIPLRGGRCVHVYDCGPFTVYFSYQDFNAGLLESVTEDKAIEIVEAGR